MLIIIYKAILYLLTWNYTSEITTIETLDHYVKSLLGNRFTHFYFNPILEQFQVKK